MFQMGKMYFLRSPENTMTQAVRVKALTAYSNGDCSCGIQNEHAMAFHRAGTCKVNVLQRNPPFPHSCTSKIR